MGSIVDFNVYSFKEIKHLISFMGASSIIINEVAGLILGRTQG
jgi:hypothetical protein